MKAKASFFLFLIVCDSALAQCPSGYITVTKRPDTLYRVKCDAGYSDGGPIVTCDQTSFDSCYTELTCNAQHKSITTSNGKQAILYGQSGGSPSIGIGFPNGETCYAPLGPGAESNALNISIGGETYHTGVLHECLKTGTAATCDQVVPGDYAIDYTINCAGDNLLGIALCGNNSGTALVTTHEEVTTSNTASANSYCWCAVISPGVSHYGLYGQLSSANECGKSCAAKCAKEIADNINFRQIIFSTFKD